jgi:Protein of unknown function (DUF2652)
MPDVANGCLVLADIGGYTTYLSGVELEHSHDILADLIGTVTDQLTGSLRLAKLEGDAVFCCDPDDKVDGPSLLTAIQSCYFAFARRQRTISTATSCDCDACRQPGARRRRRRSRPSIPPCPGWSRTWRATRTSGMSPPGC